MKCSNWILFIGSKTLPSGHWEKAKDVRPWRLFVVLWTSLYYPEVNQTSFGRHGASCTYWVKKDKKSCQGTEGLIDIRQKSWFIQNFSQIGIEKSYELVMCLKRDYSVLLNLFLASIECTSIFCLWW